MGGRDAVYARMLRYSARPEEIARAAGEGQEVIVYTPSAPSFGGCKAHNKNVRLLAKPPGTSFSSVRSRKVAAHLIATCVDSRYDGPRSAYGRALARAEELRLSLSDPLVQLYHMTREEG